MPVDELPHIGQRLRFKDREGIWIITSARWQGGGMAQADDKYEDGYHITAYPARGYFANMLEKPVEGYIKGTGCFTEEAYLPEFSLLKL